MFLLKNFIIAFGYILDIGCNILWWTIVINSLISWVNPDPYNPIVTFLRRITEPILTPIRKILPFPLKMPVDFSPLVAILLIMFLQRFIGMTLLHIVYKLS
ncbi:MAG: YggT family protein [Candidatus Omnitrophica bacterium]|nr:YggT family protein [Candidatus Omnitrophota bacterium]